MILIWVTLTSSLKPLLALFTQALLSATFLTEDGATTADGLNSTEMYEMQNSTPAFFPEPTSTPTINQTEKAMTKLEKSHILGTFAYQSSVNFDNYLKELGVSYVLRTFAGMATPVVTISKKCPDADKINEKMNPQNCTWTITTDTLFKSHEVSFRLNQPSTDITMDGRLVSFVVNQTGPNTLVEQQTSGDKHTLLVRQFSANEMKVALNVNEVRSTSIFYRLKKEND
ncbi:hypothetical protein TCAL_04841 [Tigriopus californicus]|uniref:Lipocalin/cytosolic fatty-acid binding domain-containing protein n=1 Tax=Tigriopus californicus TaxID=6832 RepID=A0A553NZA1_TIGCA|nr:fatty acid-binding protein-like [Tigriopus californicus]TRY70774.1 hypothetical protein TCAL_04841 [Tigriopus californicus]|eukprot:TCALIF_04841-PA protein Name:"Similar to Fatty acid-binding protein, muscle (Locusta migratoria)" AED:0.00 eAED:0.00 QI:263/1/1/1/1/1/2/520/227